MTDKPDQPILNTAITEPERVEPETIEVLDKPIPANASISENIRIDPPLADVLDPQPARPAVEAPVHMLSSLVTVSLDWIWFGIELPATLSIAGLPALVPLCVSLGVLNLTAVTLIQHYLDGDTWGASVAKGMAMGIIAGVPYPAFGTAVGAPLALWGGIDQLKKFLPPKTTKSLDLRK